MFRLYFYLYLTLAVCLSSAAWVLETYFPSPPAHSLEQQLAHHLLSVESQVDNALIKKSPLASFYLGDALKQPLLRGEVISVKDPEGNVYFHRLAVDGDTILSAGPYVQTEETASQSLVSLVFYSSVALAVVIFTGPLLIDLSKLRRASSKISNADFSPQVQFSRFSLLKSIGDTFDNMAQALYNRNQSQRELINAVSHDFLTPISRAKFALEAVDDNNHYRHSILQDIIELELLVEEFLTYAELEQCEPRILIKDYSPDELLQPCIAKFMSYCQLEIRINCQLEKISVDKQSFQRLLQNLLGNAVRFAKQHIEITLRHTKKGTLLIIEDDGPGIPEAMRATLMQPFSKTASVHQRGYKGVGLGLSIVKQLCIWNNAQFSLDNSSQLTGAKASIHFLR
ncbi:signal transduction histidine kinase [Pseudoalteromonas sp. MBR-15]